MFTKLELISIDLTCSERLPLCCSYDDSRSSTQYFWIEEIQDDSTRSWECTDFSMDDLPGEGIALTKRESYFFCCRTSLKCFIRSERRSARLTKCEHIDYSDSREYKYSFATSEIYITFDARLIVTEWSTDDVFEHIARFFYTFRKSFLEIRIFAEILVDRRITRTCCECWEKCDHLRHIYKYRRVPTPRRRYQDMRIYRHTTR